MILNPLIIYCLEQHINYGYDNFILGRTIWKANIVSRWETKRGPLGILLRVSHRQGRYLIRMYKSGAIDYHVKSVDWLDIADEYS